MNNELLFEVRFAAGAWGFVIEATVGTEVAFVSVETRELKLDVPDGTGAEPEESGGVISESIARASGIGEVKVGGVMKSSTSREFKVGEGVIFASISRAFGIVGAEVGV